ncbi:MAG TPA: aquaporin [Gemmatimonadales bacterium]|nr:aquaporin [Gemmatimonadales bacterium]
MSLLRRAIAEFAGTFGFVFLACAAVVIDNFPSARFGLVGIAAITGLALAAMVAATAGVSGGMLNPAITVAMVATRRLGLTEGGALIGAQLVGAVAAVGMLMLALPAGVGTIVLWGTPLLSARVATSDGILIEAVLTAILTLTWLGTIGARRGEGNGGAGGIAVGLALVALTLVGQPLTGAALNPARAFGPALFGGNFANQVVWWVGPMVGALVAAAAWRLIETRDR